jgi:hypothetical protein
MRRDSLKNFDSSADLRHPDALSCCAFPWSALQTIEQRERSRWTAKTYVLPRCDFASSFWANAASRVQIARPTRGGVLRRSCAQTTARQPPASAVSTVEGESPAGEGEALTCHFARAGEAFPS